jgi:hypothetical protein
MRPCRLSSALAVSLAAGVLAALPGVAHAQLKSVALLGCGGPQGDAGATAIEGALGTKYGVISTALYTSTYKSLGLKATDFAQVAAALGATALVYGEVEKSGSNWLLDVTVYDGADGKVLTHVDELLDGPMVGPATQARLTVDLPPAIDRARGAGGAAVATTPPAGAAVAATPPAGAPTGESDNPLSGTTTGATATTPVPTEAAAPSATPTPAASGTGVDNPDESSLGETTFLNSDNGEAETSSSGSNGGKVTGLDLGVGLSFLGRQFHFAATTATQGYDGPPVPGARLDLAAYPVALAGGTGALAGLGVGFVLDRALFISSAPQNMPSSKLSTTEQELGVDLRYRKQVGDPETGPTLRFRVGYGAKQFTVDHSSGTVLLPDVSYKYLAVGAGIAVPLGSPVWSLIGDVTYLPILSTGPLGDSASYGGGGKNGVDVQVGVAWQPRPWLVLQASGRYMGVFLSFDGQGTLTQTAGKQTVSGATDQYYGGFLTASYIY